MRNATNLGFSRNLLVCLEQSRGEYIKFLCDDDWLLSTSIRLQSQVLADCPDVSMVTNHRFLCDANDSLLPPRATNCFIAVESAVLNGGDLLDAVATNAPNLFGGLSHVLLRRALVEQSLAMLVQEGQGFSARLDMALYICLLRRGHLGYLQQMLSIERMHAGRLSHHTSMEIAFRVETEWLLQMPLREQVNRRRLPAGCAM